jgi:hypothetical protein
MPRFYFNLASKDAHIPDDSGKELATLNDAYVHARELIDKILFRVGDDDAEAWTVVIFKICAYGVTSARCGLSLLHSGKNRDPPLSLLQPARCIHS